MKVLQEPELNGYIVPDGHALTVWYDHDQKGMAVKCGCGWQFNGVFSSPAKAKDTWWEHAREFDNDSLLLKQLKERSAVFEKSQEIIDEFMGPYNKRKNRV